MKSFFQRILHDSHPGHPEPPPLTAPQTYHFRPPTSGKEERPSAPTSKYSRHEDSGVFPRPSEKRSSSRAGPTPGNPPNDRLERIPPTGYEARLPASRNSPPPANFRSLRPARPMTDRKAYEPSLQGGLNVDPYPESSTERLYNQMDRTHLPHMHTPSQNERIAMGRVTPQKRGLEPSGRHDDMYKHRDGNKSDRKDHREVEPQRLGNSDRNKSKTREERTERRRGEESDRDTRGHQREIDKGSQRPRDKETDWETDRDMETERETDRERNKERERGKESYKDREKKKVREGNRERDKDKGREKEREQRRVREHGRESGREKDKIKENERGEARDSEKDKARSSEKKIVEQARDERKEEKDRDRMNNEGANKNGRIRETERERYERRERDRKHSGEGRTKRDRDREEKRPHKPVTDAMKAGPYRTPNDLDLRREPPSESVYGIPLRAQDDGPSRTSGVKPEKATWMVCIQSLFLQIYSLEIFSPRAANRF